MALTAAEANAQLKDIKTVEQLRTLISQLDITAEGNVTLLFSGDSEGGESYREIAISVAEKNSNIRILTNTEAADFLDVSNNDALRDTLERIFKSNPLIPGTTANKFLNGETDVHGNRIANGAWDEVSARFASATTGEVRVLTSPKKTFGVFALAELPNLLENERVTQIDGISREHLVHLKNSQGLEFVKHALAANAFAQMNLSGLLEGDVDSYLKFTPDDLEVALKDPAKRQRLITLLSETMDVESLVNLETGISALRQGGEIAHLNGVPKALNRMGMVGGLLSLMFVTNSVLAAETREEAVEIATTWGVEMVGESIGGMIAGAAAGIAIASIATVSAPVTLALVLGASFVGGFLGAEGATRFYGMLGDSEEAQRKNILNRLSELYFGKDSALILDSIPNPGTDFLPVDSGSSIESMVGAAKGSIAWRYALLKLNPFVVPNANYNKLHNSSGELELYDSATGKGLTDEYLRARAEALKTVVQLFDNEETVRPGQPYPGGYDHPFADATLETGEHDTGAALDLHPVDDLRDQRLFGAAGNDKLVGGSGDDMLFGGEGSDNLEGNLGSDYLEGGPGDDSYHAGAGDIILDHDGQGRVFFNGKPLFGGTREYFVSVYKDNRGYRYAVSGDDLEVSKDGQSLTIRNFENGQLGIELVTYGSETPEDAGTIRGSDQDDHVVMSHEAPYVSVRLDGEIDTTQDGLYPSGIAFVYGNGGADEIVVQDIGMHETIRIEGGSGNDMLQADVIEAHDYYSNGGALPTSTDGAYLDGGAGDDVFFGSLRNDRIDGGAGHDVTVGYHGDDTVLAGDGNDWIDGNESTDSLFGELGDDRLFGGAGTDYLFGDEGNDRLYGDSESQYVHWNGAEQTVTPDPNLDYSFVVDGTSLREPPFEYAFVTDVATIEAGDDFLTGGDGEDQLFGGSGDDNLYGGNDRDILFGEAGDDYLSGGDGNDDLIGDKAVEQLAADAQVRLTLDYPAGQAHFHWRDYVDAADVDGDDRLFGGPGYDMLQGNGGADELYGGDDKDTLYGGDGNDILNGDRGSDHLFGGADDDTYVFNANWGFDVIQDNGGMDEIHIGAGLTRDDVKIYRSGDDLMFFDKTAGNRLISLSWFSDTDSRIEQVVFADGSRLGTDEIRTAVLHQEGGDSKDVLEGYIDEANTLSGGGGHDELIGANLDDRLFGGDGNDTLDGRGGNDELDGGLGGDSYLLGLYDGQVTVRDNADDGLVNTVKFVPGLLPGTVYAQTSGDDLILSWNDGAGGATLQDYALSPEVWRFEAASGNLITVEALLDPPSPNNRSDQDEWDRFRETTYAQFLNQAGAPVPKPFKGTVIVSPFSNYIPGNLPSTEELQALGMPLVKALDFLFTSALSRGGGWQFCILDSGPKSVDKVEIATVTGSDGPDNLLPGEAITYETQDQPVYLTLQAGEPSVDGQYFADIAHTSYTRPAHIPQNELRRGGDTYNNILRTTARVMTRLQRLPIIDGDDGNDRLGSLVFERAGIAGTYHERTISSSSYFRNPLMIDGGVGDDRLYGGRSGDFLVAGAGNDRLHGYGGDDTLVAGAGDDALFGHAGADRYLIDFSTPGHDQVVDNGLFLNGDVSMLSEALPGVSSSDLEALFLTAEQTFADQLLADFPDTFEAADDTVVINSSLEDVTLRWAAPDSQERLGIAIASNAYSDTSVVVRTRGRNDFLGFGIERFEFSDVTLSQADVLAMLPALPEHWQLIGSRDDDRLLGTNAQDILVGREGDDELNGQDGDDVYLYNPGDGYDYIRDFSFSTNQSGSDTLSFGTGIRPEDVWVSLNEGIERSDTHQYLNIKAGYGLDDRIKIKWTYTRDNRDRFVFEDSRIEHVQFMSSSAYQVFDLIGLVEHRFDELLAAGQVDTVIPLFTPELLGSFEISSETNGPYGGEYATNYATKGDIYAKPGAVAWDDKRGSADADDMAGNEGNDRIDGAAGDDVLDGGAGNDLLIGGTGNDRMTGGLGDDTFVVQGFDAGVDIVSGGDGEDTIVGGYEDDTIRLFNFRPSNSVETIDGRAGFNTLAGTAHSDRLDFSKTNLTNIDRIDVGDGNDRVIGSAGNDTIVGGDGNDMLDGGPGDDIFLVAGQLQTMDVYSGGDGIDSIMGGIGDDTINLYRFDASHGVEFIDGGAGDNTIAGTRYRDRLDFSATTVTNIDRIDSGGGADEVIGSSGNDTIIGGTGDDTLAGGDGNDTYVFTSGSGIDRVRENGLDSTGDTIVFDANPLTLAFSRSENDLSISRSGSNDQVIVENWYDDANGQVESLNANGNMLRNTQVDQLIQAMVTFTADQGATNWEQAVTTDSDAATSLVATFWQAAS